MIPPIKRFLKEQEQEQQAFHFLDQMHKRFNTENVQMELTGGIIQDRRDIGKQWFMDMIIAFQNSPALHGTAHQYWSVKRVQYGKLQVLCRDHNKDVLIARVVRKKLPFSELHVEFINHQLYRKGG